MEKLAKSRFTEDLILVLGKHAKNNPEVKDALDYAQNTVQQNANAGAQGQMGGF